MSPLRTPNTPQIMHFLKLSLKCIFFSENRECVCLFGDCNAKPDNLQDFVQPDQLLYIFNLNGEPDLISYMYDNEILTRAIIPLHRKTTCVQVGLMHMVTSC